MRLVIRYRESRWMRAIRLQFEFMADNVNASGFEYHYDSGGEYPTRWMTCKWWAEELWFTLWTKSMCAVVDHDWVDEDPGDPEVGPRPYVRCVRCHTAI